MKKILAIFSIVLAFLILTKADTAYAATLTILDDPNGGACNSSLGVWNPATKTCVMDRNSGDSIVIGSDGITLDGNGRTLSDSGIGIGVSFTGRTGITVKNLIVSGFNIGIRGYNSGNSNVLSNNIVSNNIGVVFDQPYGSNNLISGNTIRSVGTGIQLINYAHNNTIIGNAIESNASSGIFLGESFENTIKNNTINNNGKGIYLFGPGTKNNYIYNNNFLGNSTQVYLQSLSTTGSNFFNLAAPTGGNYWSNRNSPDNNGDRFVDSPYYFNPYNADALPWTAQNAWLDNVPPVTHLDLAGTIGSDSWYVSNVTMTLSAVDNAGGLGVDKIQYNLNNTAWVNYTVPVTISANGVTDIYFRSIDRAKNVEVAQMQTIKIDNVSPIITVAPYVTTPTNQDITVNASTNEGTLNFTFYTFTVNGSFDFVATDLAGNTATETVTISNIDKVAPLITLVGDNPAAVEAGSLYVDAGATALDDIDGDITSSIIVSGSVNTAVIGTYLITYNVSDAAGNAATAVTRAVNVVDTTAPIIIAPANITIEATGSATSVVLGAATATDAADPSPVIVNNAPTNYSVGTTTIIWTATDASGNSASATSRVTITDLTIPTIALHEDMTVEATSADGAVVIYASPIAADLVDGSMVAVCVLASGSTFALGNIEVTCTAADVAGNIATSNFNVIVQDTNPPSITVPADVTQEATGILSNVDLGIPVVTDMVDVSPIVINNASANYSVGTTLVTWTATDASGNSASVIQTVTITDTTAPIITVPANITTEATGSGTSVVLGIATAVDMVDGSVLASNNAPVLFSLGTTIVAWTAIDASGNTAVATQTVTVMDTTAPVITLIGLASVTLEAGSSYTDPGAAASDLVSGDLSSVVVATGSVNSSAVGSYLITYNVSDAAGNPALPVERIVNVTDTTAELPEYLFSGFLNPINSDGSSLFKLGRTVPVKFQLTDYQGGSYAPNAVAFIYLSKISNSITGTLVEAISTSSATTGNLFRYDLSSNQYIFNLSTSNLTAGTWKIIAKLESGKELGVVNISLK
jgi:parallel beta-helix repeat protein